MLESPPFPWQQSPFEVVQRWQQVPQALLLSGMAGLGKRQFAEQMAKDLLCVESASKKTSCQKIDSACHSCSVLAAGNHPDSYLLEPEGLTIKIDALRAILEKLPQAPQLGHNQVVLIDSAEKMNMATANALLKNLEEPNPSTFFLLISSQMMLLPATVRSRCHVLRFAPQRDEATLQWLAEKIPDGQIDLYLNLAGGAPLAALAIAQDKDKKLQTLQADLFEFNLNTDPLALAQKWNKQALSITLPFLILMLTRAIKQQFEPTLQTPQPKLNLRSAYQLYDELQILMREQQRTTLNAQLMLEHIFQQWKECYACRTHRTR